MHRYTRARFDLIAGDGRIAGRRSRDGRAWSLVAAGHDALVDDAVARAARSRDPAPLAPGEYDVILEPHAVAELLEWLALTSLGARAVEDGSSGAGRPRGERLTGAALTPLRRRARRRRRLPRPRPSTPKARRAGASPSSTRGVAREVGPRSRLGRARRHALDRPRRPVGDELFEGGPSPQHLMVAGGDASVDELISRVDRGLYVARFHYVNGLLDTRRALMTGMTRDGLWRIEGGKLAGPVANLRWTESFLDARASHRRHLARARARGRRPERVLVRLPDDSRARVEVLAVERPY